ncbi:MAG TPA: efflux RND transporter periplasmic adaptor subunit [Gemmata sp.]
MTTATTAPAPRGWAAPVRTVGTALLALAALAAFLAWMGGAFRAKVEPGEAPVPHDSAAGRTLATVEKQTVAELAPVVGSVQPRRRTEVSSQVLARIVDVKVRPGDTVQPDQELIRLDNRELLAQEAEAQAAAAVAEADLVLRKVDYARAVKERDSSVISAADFARYEGAFKVSEAQVKRAKENINRLAVQLTYTRILANARGVVADRFADPGDIANPGKVLMVIYDPAELELHVNVPEGLAPDLREGQKLGVEIEAAGLKGATGVVREVVPLAQQASRSVLVKVTLPRVPSAKPLLPGMYGRVGVPVGTAERLFVPRAAVHQLGQLDLVAVAGADGTLGRRFVRTGPVTGDRVEILAGLSAGERVALPAR